MTSPSARPVSRQPGTLAEARELIASVYAGVTGREDVPLHACGGRCLADDVVAPIDLPPFDVAAMDGYALRSGDLDGQGHADLQVRGDVAAGHPYLGEIGRGETVRIYTGAVIPPGVDRVVPQEHCRREGDRVTVAARPGGKLHIRLSGEDVLAGQKVIAAGSRLEPAQLALLSALRLEKVPVLRRLRVVLLSVGDELSQGSGPYRYGGIVDSNRPMLKGWLEKAGCDVDDIGILPDSADILLRRLVEAATTADLIVTSGGASVGPADHLARSIRRRGFLEFWKLAMRPGKPVGLGDIDDCPILALPGNPFAAATTFTLIGRPLIARLSGDASASPAPLILPLGHRVSTRGDHLHVLAGRLALSRDGRTVVQALDAQGSASLMAVSGAQGLILLPGDRKDFHPDDLVEFVAV